MDLALDNVLTVRASVGARLQELDALDSAGEDRHLQYSQTLSELQDLDYASALTELSKQQTILEAAQRSFVTVFRLVLVQLHISLQSYSTACRPSRHCSGRMCARISVNRENLKAAISNLFKSNQKDMRDHWDCACSRQDITMTKTIPTVDDFGSFRQWRLLLAVERWTDA